MASSPVSTVLSVCILVSFMSAASALTWSSCAPPTALASIQSISLSPNPPVRGKPVTIAVAVKIKTQIAGGTAAYTAKYNNKAVLVNTKVNICLSGVKCPLKAGPVTLKTSLTVPKYAPVGAYNLGISVVNTLSAPVLCVNASFSILT
eukprot:TRINITY_DN10_c0_g1_i5.p1 TRINITY_DN10_c0_g1~~TRINITY_DN10_c0_g1_i5.p1  ORF type:complete len:148 (+),score=10.17 TRINITY_DN10_c0_g1_i5:109-552(+)